MKTRPSTRFPASTIAALAAAAAIGLLPASTAPGQDFELAPIEYSKTPGADRIARLIERIGRGEVKLDRDARRGYLPAILEELEIPASSQVLVFSKTSFQRELIGPDRPRALYFNDDVYVGFCRYGEVLELAAQDPRQGTIFGVIQRRVAPGYEPRFCSPILPLPNSPSRVVPKGGPF